MNIVILAGGKGTRFWPASTKKEPKQLFNFFSNSSLLQQTVDRVSPIAPKENIYIVTEASLEPEIRKQLPFLQEMNIIVEPVGRNTLPCIGLAALYLRRNEERTMAVLPSDHLIRNQKKFHKLLRFAEYIVRKHNVLVTFGITPTRPETGYGYIHFGKEKYTEDGFKAFEVLEFVEKPDAETAKKYLESGRYLWNSGMFVWQVDTILSCLRKHAASIYEKLSLIDDKIGIPEETDTINKIYPQIEAVSIDYGVMEKADNVVVIPADIGWNDMGSFAVMHEVLEKDSSENAVHGKHIEIDTENCVIYSPNKLIATIGIKDLVIVENDKALLVCPLERAQEVKALVEKLEVEGLEEYL